jgi:arylsulfatase A-like enzyme
MKFKETGAPTMDKQESTRRDFLKSVGLGTLGLTAMGSCATAKAAGDGKRPNLLIIHTDQQSSWTVSAYGGKEMTTPHIDSIAERGALFGNFFTNSAVCSPSRACLVTGRYPNSHGVFKNNIPMKKDEVTFATVLKKAGYETGYAGKWHLNGTPKPGWAKPSEGHGFEDCKHLFNRGHWKIIEEQPEGEPRLSYKEIGDETTYTTDWLAAKTIEFIRKPRTLPFCFMVSIPDPHTPYTIRKPYDTMFNPEEMILPATINEREGKAARVPKAYKKFEARLRKSKAQYCGEVKCIDDSVGRIIACLKKQGLFDDTIVVFTTDHGDYMGEHGLMGKNKPYETAFRIPLVVCWPKGIPRGLKIPEIFSTVDFAPTLLTLMGVKPGKRMEGNDASHLLLDKKGKWENVSYSYHSSNNYAGLFTPEYQFMISKKDFTLKDAPSRILYDRANDPDQTRNLIDDPKYKDLVHEFKRRVIRHHSRLKTPALEWLKEL